MLVAILAFGSILGSRPLSAADPARQVLIIRSEGVVMARFDADGFVQARGCDGRLHDVGMLSERPVAIRLSNDGMIQGLVYQPALGAQQQAAFQGMMRAFGYSDWASLAAACLPEELPTTTTAAAASDAATPASATQPIQTGR